MVTPFQQHSQFYKDSSFEQKPNEIVNAANWDVGRLEFYTEGARGKKQLRSPDSPEFKFIIPKHQYMLKQTYVEKSGTVLYWQFWNEIIAYKLGRVLGIKVPPAYVAYYQEKDKEPYYGALIEWFYDYSGQTDKIKRGGDIIINYIPGYDTKKGEKHNFQTVSEICANENVENWLEEWASILLFDALIGNTDRHQDNWQIIQWYNSTTTLSPAFDNGTSLGYRIRDDHTDKWLAGLEKHTQAGYHHMKWLKDDLAQAKHFELLQKILAKYPNLKTLVAKILTCDITPALTEIKLFEQFEIKDKRYSLSSKRIDFIIKMLQFRQMKAKDLLIS